MNSETIKLYVQLIIWAALKLPKAKQSVYINIPHTKAITYACDPSHLSFICTQRRAQGSFGIAGSLSCDAMFMFVLTPQNLNSYFLAKLEPVLTAGDQFLLCIQREK